MEERPQHAKVTLTDLEDAFGTAAPPFPVRIEPVRFPGQPADLLDPDGDGLVTLVKLALGLDPQVADVADVLVVGTVHNTSPPVISLTYRRDTSRPELEIEVRFSTDLVEWTTDGITESVISTHGAIELTKASVVGNPARRGFFQIRVRRN
jgi:hypothetical protein